MLVNESKHFLSHRLDGALAAVREGFDVHLITRLLHDRSEVEGLGIRVHHMEFPRALGNPMIELRTLRNLRQLYDQLQPDLLHHFSAKAVLMGSLAARSLRLRHVVNTFTGLGAAFTGREKRAALRRVLATQCFRRLLRPSGWQTTFQNSEDMRQLVDAGIVAADQCEVIPGSGVDPSQFRLTQDLAGAPVVMLASRMIWPKGVAEFVAAASLLKEMGTDARFVLVGEPDRGSATAVPVEQLQSWHDQGVIEWWGHCSDMPATIGRANIVVLPTFYGEGLPKVLLEAASCGKPIVATDIRGCRDIVHHDKNGILIPPRDVESLTTTLWRMIHNPAQRRRMGLRGREIVLREFTADRVADQTVGIYRRMLSLPARPRCPARRPLKKISA